MEEVLKNAEVAINDFHSQTLLLLTGGASIEERDTWVIKEEAARAFLDNIPNTIQHTMVMTECGLTGEDPLEFCQLVVYKSDKFREITALASGFRRKCLQQLKTCETPEEVETLLAAIQPQAEQLIAQATG